MLKDEGELTITRVMSSHEPDFVEIVIANRANLTVARCRVSLEVFGSTVLGLGAQSCTITHWTGVGTC